MSHLRYSGLSKREQQAIFTRIISQSSLMREVLARARQLNLPQWRVVSGALYNLVWNILTGRPEIHGIKDIDLFYFDASDLSYEAEDAHIQAGSKLFHDLPLPVEIRNQARVHLWFEHHFGQAYPPLISADEGIDRFASKTHAVGSGLRPRLKIDLRGRLKTGLKSMRLTGLSQYSGFKWYPTGSSTIALPIVLKRYGQNSTGRN